MNKIFVIIFLTFVASAAHSEFHVDKKVFTLHSPDARTCSFFKLEGVSQADQVTPGVSWFAVSSSHHAYDQIFSILLSARMSDKSVSVATTGNIVCGHAEVSHVII